MTYKELLQIAADLDRYAELEGTELGEAWKGLTQLVPSTPYLSVEFRGALEREIAAQLAHCKAHARIESREETHTQLWAELVWDDERA